MVVLYDGLENMLLPLDKVLSIIVYSAIQQAGECGT
jgi:hypothetical protein